MNNNNYIFSLIVITLFFNIKLTIAKTDDFKLKENSYIRVSSSFYQSLVDTVVEKEYNKIKKIYDKKEYVSALSLALNYYDEIKNKDLNLDQRSSFLILLGDIYHRTNDYTKALKYYKKSLALYNFTEDKENSYMSNYFYARSLLKIGAIFQKLEKKDSASYYYDRINRLNSLNDEVAIIKAASYANLSGIYFKDGLYDKAEKFALTAIDIHRKRNDKLKEANALNNLANVYIKQELYEKAKSIYLKAIDLIEKDSSTVATVSKASFYYNLAWAMRNLKDYKAYDYQEISYDILDDIRDIEIRTMIESVTAAHNVDTAKAVARKEAQRNTWILGISSLFIIVLLVFLLNQYKLRQKNLGLELSKQELMQQQKLEKVRSESQIRILNATLDGKETERKQIAETLHDSVSALLSSANLHLQACKKQFNGSSPIEVDKSQSIINEASQKIRDLSHTLVSSILLKFGLSYAVKDITEKFSNSQLKVDYETKYIKRYDQGFEIKLYNIIQELLNNILKHSEASYAKITLVEKREKIFLTIEDDGKGFDIDLIPKKDGLGINQIDARIKVMKGIFDIKSNKENGTLINIELPVFEKKLTVIS